MERNTTIGGALALMIAMIAVLTAVVVRSDSPDVDDVTAARESLPAQAADGVPTTTRPARSTSTVPATSTAPTAPEAGATAHATSAIPSTTAGDRGAEPNQLESNIETLALRFESRVDDIDDAAFSAEAMSVLVDPRGWRRAGVSFVAVADAPHLVVLAEPSEVDRLCLPLETRGEYSCQQGPVVAVNAERWRRGVAHWDGDLASYRAYLVNHEIGHLFGQRHPTPRCPVAGGRASVMEQQTISLEGCVGNPWPLDWETRWASRRPLTIAPLSDWDGPRPINEGDPPR